MLRPFLIKINNNGLFSIIVEKYIIHTTYLLTYIILAMLIISPIRILKQVSRIIINYKLQYTNSDFNDLLCHRAYYSVVQLKKNNKVYPENEKPATLNCNCGVNYFFALPKHYLRNRCTFLLIICILGMYLFR